MKRPILGIILTSFVTISIIHETNTNLFLTHLLGTIVIPKTFPENVDFTVKEKAIDEQRHGRRQSGKLSVNDCCSLQECERYYTP